jgi:hypothetical protein
MIEGLSKFNNNYPKPEYPGGDFFEDTVGILASWRFGFCRARARQGSSLRGSVLPMQIVDPTYRLCIADFSKINLGG